jgi:predicted amidohydrolase
MKIGLGQLLVEGGEPERNIERAIELIIEAKENKCDLILLPETLDFGWTHPSSLKESQPIPGKFSEILCQEAIKNNIWICAGLTEKIENKNFNAAILINRKGEILNKYHKINVLDVGLPFYEIGQTLSVIDTEFGKIGINICADNYADSMSIGHTLAKMGAQIILSPSSWTVDYSVSEEDDPYNDKWIKPYSFITGLYDITIIGVTAVGYIVGGPYEGKKSVGCSLVVENGKLINEGRFNEFTSELIVIDLSLKNSSNRGTNIGKMLKDKGYQFDGLGNLVN